DLRATDVVDLVEGLAMKVRDLDSIGIDEHERADTGGPERHRCRRAEATDADDEHVARGEAGVGFVDRRHRTTKKPLSRTKRGSPACEPYLSPPFPLGRASVGISTSVPCGTGCCGVAG